MLFLFIYFQPFGDTDEPVAAEEDGNPFGDDDEEGNVSFSEI